MKKPLLLLAVLALAACASKQVNQKVNSDVAATPAATHEDLRKQVSDLIDKGQFTPEQKTKLKDLRVATSGQMKSLYDEGMKLRSLLLKEVISKKGDKLEISAIEDKMRENSKKRLALIFDTVKKTNEIIGRNSIEQDRLRIFDDIIMDGDRETTDYLN